MFFEDSCYEAALADTVSALKAKRVLIVHGKHSFTKTSLKSDILTALHNVSSIEEICFFSDFSVNPDFSSLQKALKQFHSIPFDCIIGAGGGSAMDMAKLIRFFLCFNGDIESAAYKANNDVRIPLICIPTTAGTGAETTQFAVVYKNGKKYSVDHTGVLPDYAFVVPKYTYGNPAYLTACSGFDALAQAIESIWSIRATAESIEYAQKAITLIYRALPIAVNGDVPTARNALSHGSWLSGKAINITRTTAPHAYSYIFTSKYGIPHGHAVALTFPFFIRWNIERLDLLNNVLSYNEYSKRIALLQNMLDLNDTPEQQCYSYLAEIGLTPSIPYETDIDAVLASVNTIRLKNNPIEVDNSELKKYLVQIQKQPHN